MTKEENKNLKFLSLSLDQREAVEKARNALEIADKRIFDHKAKRASDLEGLDRKNKKEYIEKHRKELLKLQRDHDQKYLDLCGLEEELGINAWRRKKIEEKIK